MSRLGVSRYACITIVLLDRSFLTESSSEKRLLLHYFNLTLYDLWQYRPRSSKTVRLLVSRVFSSHNKMTETEICWYFPDCRWLQLIFQQSKADFSSYVSDLSGFHNQLALSKMSDSKHLHRQLVHTLWLNAT